ncbi:MAG: ferrochelatase [Bacteroidetes bacterium]|nr:ferrochelatase [Bacteroidota bacterium]MBS1758085.1 ferrochelatase [Bacteroidota bacterium]
MQNTVRGILLMNLGSPDSTEVKDVKKYLDEFLMDERVIDMPYLLRLLIVKGFITPRRSAQSAEAYKTIWTSEGSPLIVLTEKLRDALQQLVKEPVEIAMRYGSLTPKIAFDNLLKRTPGLNEVIAVPLYPHYAMSSYETAVVHAREIHKKNNYNFSLKFIEPYYNSNDYINALAESMKPYLQEEYDHILFSYHGVPGRHIRKSDTTGNHCLQSAECCNTESPAHAHCYRHQCFTSTNLVTKKLGIAKEKFSISFQSRLGKGWLEPFTDIRLAEMPKEGIKKLLIICPAFVSDCLETLEEIAIRGEEIFLQAGGETFKMIPCMNVQPEWVNALKNLVLNEA